MSRSDQHVVEVIISPPRHWPILRDHPDTAGAVFEVTINPNVHKPVIQMRMYSIPVLSRTRG